MFRSTNRPAQNFATVIKVARFCSGLIGVDVASPDFRINWMTCVVIASITVYFVCTVMTVVKFFDEKPTFLMEASCMIGSVLQGVTKLATGCVHTKTFVALRFELEELYAEYQEKDSSYCVVLHRNCKRSWNIIVSMGWVYFFVIWGITLTPFVFLFLTGKRYMMMSYEIPGVDVETTYGYFVTTAAHTVCIFVAAFGLFAGDLFLVIYLSQAILFADIFELKVRDLNKCIADGIEARQRQAMIKDLIEWHKKYNAFNDKCNNAFYYIIAVQITTAGISILFTLYIFLYGDWPGAYTYVFHPILGTYAYCFLGTQIEKCNDRFSGEIYNIDWFMLPVLEQKLIVTMLVKSQFPSKIKIGGVIPLSVHSGLQLSRGIYTIFMMMVRLLDE